MSACEYELVVLRPEDFDEVISFIDKHFLTQNPLVRILICMYSVVSGGEESDR